MIMLQDYYFNMNMKKKITVDPNEWHVRKFESELVK